MTASSTNESSINSSEPSTRYLEKGNFFRVATIGFQYNLPLKKESAFQDAQLFAIIQNPFIFTQYSGLDPEVNVGASYGIDYIAYPMSRTFTLGIAILL